MNDEDDPTLILDLIEGQEWEAAIRYAKTCPASTKTILISNNNNNNNNNNKKDPIGNSLMEPSLRSQGNLALHEACKYSPTVAVIDTLLQLNENAIKTKGQCGYLPLHFACTSKASTDVIARLIKAYPAAARARESIKEALPLHLAVLSAASEDAIMEVLTAFPEGSFMRDGAGKTPIEHATALPSRMSRDRALQTLEGAPLLVAAAKAATIRVSQDYEKKLKGLNDAHAEFIRQIEARHEQDKTKFLELEVGFKIELAEEKERNIALAERIIQLKQTISNSNAEINNTHAILATERIDFRAKLEKQDREYQSVIQGTAEQVEKLKEQMEQDKTEIERLETRSKNFEIISEECKKLNADMKVKEATIQRLQELLDSKEKEIETMTKQVQETTQELQGTTNQLQALENVHDRTIQQLEDSKTQVTQLRKGSEALQVELFKTAKRLNIQEHRFASVKNLVSSLSSNMQSWEMDDEWDRNHERQEEEQWRRQQQQEEQEQQRFHQPQKQKQQQQQQSKQQQGQKQEQQQQRRRFVPPPPPPVVEGIEQLQGKHHQLRTTPSTEQTVTTVGSSSLHYRPSPLSLLDDEKLSIIKSDIGVNGNDHNNDDNNSNNNDNENVGNNGRNGIVMVHTVDDDTSTLSPIPSPPRNRQYNEPIIS